MTRNLGEMSPLEDEGPQSRGNKQAIVGIVAGTGLVLHGGPHSLFNLPGEGSKHARGRKDGNVSWDCIPLLLELVRQGIRFDVARPWSVGEGEVEAGEKDRPPGLLGVESLGCAHILQIQSIPREKSSMPSSQ